MSINEIDNNKIKSILFDLSKRFILPMYKNLKDTDIMKKNNNDLVTSVDLQIEHKLRNILCKLLPNSLFIGEEEFSKTPDILNYYLEKKYCWTVDPIDGTTNFSKGKEKFAVMIALSFCDQILQSWIYKPLTEDLCFAIKGGGTFLNDKKINIINSLSIDKTKGSISLKYWDGNYLNIMKNLKNNFREVKSYGCIGFEYMDIANNIRDFAILSKLSPWDHLPGILILREAGGFDSYFDDGMYNHSLQKKNLVVTRDINLGNKILELIKE
tara:strand:+ start:605 stop:1411 length:807 start_codon:yes stop_codon:yes gene_type:complete